MQIKPPSQLFWTFSDALLDLGRVKYTFFSNYVLVVFYEWNDDDDDDYAMNEKCQAKEPFIMSKAAFNQNSDI